jgi:hypothetical protein
VQVVNKPGASTQVGTTEFVKSRPDGYTLLLWAMPAAATIYLDPERQSAYARKDFVPLANAVVEPLALAVRADSPYKTLQEVIDDVAEIAGNTAYSYSNTIDDGASPIAGAKIYLFNNEDCTGTPKVYVTNDLGQFTVYTDTPGTYWIQIAASGMDTQTVEITTAAEGS